MAIFKRVNRFSDTALEKEFDAVEKALNSLEKANKGSIEKGSFSFYASDTPSGTANKKVTIVIENSRVKEIKIE